LELDFHSSSTRRMPELLNRLSPPDPTPTRPCDPESTMKVLLAIVVAVVIAGSLFADYKWRQWIAARKRDRQ
jgi:hypothetical protein